MTKILEHLLYSSNRQDFLKVSPSLILCLLFNYVKRVPYSGTLLEPLVVLTPKGSRIIRAKLERE